MTRIALFAAFSVLAFTPASAREVTRQWNFDVSLDGRPIGEHRFTLRDSGAIRELTSEAQFQVRFLFINAYRYEHRARERWQGDCLEGLDASTNANGKALEVAGQRDGDGFQLQSGRIRNGSAAVIPDECVQTFAYWNPRILDAQRLLNPQTGEYSEIRVLPMGREVLAGQKTERFRLISRGGSPLEIDLWYTPGGDWVALESVTPEGRRLRYDRK
jgi:hypothetical protein